MAEVENTNYVVPFTLDKSKTRGRFVRLDTALHTFLMRHNYPRLVNIYLGQLCALLSVFVADIKRQGVSTLQVSCDNGPITFMVVDLTNKGHMRACASFNEEKLDALINPSFSDIFAGGRLLYSVDMTHTQERYQTVVPLEGASFAEAMHTYFHQSEQVPTAVVIHHSAGENIKDAPQPLKFAALMLQQLPDSSNQVSEHEREDWFTNMALMATVTKDEMLDKNLNEEAMLFRLFHERDLHVIDTVPLRFVCRCSNEKSRQVLMSFSSEQLNDMQEQDGKIHMTCKFCNANYAFLPNELST